MRFVQPKRDLILCWAFVISCALLVAVTFSGVQFGRGPSNNITYQVEKGSRIQKTAHNESLNNIQPETIHLAIVCGRFNSTRNFYVLLKSILFYRTDPIHLHLYVDDISYVILSELFRNWLIPDFKVEYYNMTNREDEVSWIPNQHYSHRFGLMKLVFLSELGDRQELEKVILLDTDMLALGNINNIWNYNEAHKKVFGMVENKSDWYLGKLHSVWRAIGRGFNSGLILVNLAELQLSNWPQLWRSVAETELTTQLSTPLADQDIFNSIARAHSDMFYELPCSFNIQLNDHSEVDENCLNKTGFMLIHWNSPYKLATKNIRADYFNNWYLTFQNWDGGLLVHTCCSNLDINQELDQNSLGESNEDLFCKDIRPRPQEKLRTFLYFKEFELEYVENDVTFVVHLSLDRFETLDQLASHWSGPISASVYLSESDTGLLLDFIENSDNLATRNNIGLHLVYRSHGFSYPINRMRNVALNNAITPYVFLCDIDFLPSLNLYQYLRQVITDLWATDKNSDQKTDPLAKRALVVPAFENLQYKFEFPSSKADLLTQLNLGSISMFREHLWPQGHAATDYAKWRASTTAYFVDWKPEYEPFIVTTKSVCRFDERFVGFGWNKVEHTMHLAAMNYKFSVLPEAFVIHKLHSASSDIRKHRESYKYRACVKQLKKNFLKTLRLSFPNFFKSMSVTNKPVKQIS